MYDLTKQQKLNFIKEQVTILQIRAYEIAKNTSLTEAGIGKILNGTVKNPQERSLNEIIEYLEKKMLGSNTDNTSNTVKKTDLNESIEKQSTNNFEDLIKYAECLEKENKLIKEIVKLHGILRDNNIDFENFFENERK